MASSPSAKRAGRTTAPPGARTTNGTVTAEPQRSEGEAARQAVTGHSVSVPVPIVGRITFPSAQHLAFYAGVVTLAVVEIVEWPIAVLLMAGRAMADNHHNRALQEFGEALEEAG